MRLDTQRLQTLDQVREFLAGQPTTRPAAADSGRGPTRSVAEPVERFDYLRRGKADKGLLRRFPVKVTGSLTSPGHPPTSPAPTTGAITDRRGLRRRPTARVADVA
ncbi:MAG: hypothetical protein OXG35_20025 [Acidobacteria bacterium]|nr:hypothetical protein [Acidobacteriota bacterium]